MPDVEMKEIKSTAIHSYGYDEQGQELHIAYRQKIIPQPELDPDPQTLPAKRTYIYIFCPPQMLEAFLEAESKGGWLAEQIRKGLLYLKPTEGETRDYEQSLRSQERLAEAG